jgi:branched-chain amino acid transport system substrate-binding protein
MTEVLPRAIKKYGGIDRRALRKAALEVDLPEGGTMLGFGVKFFGEARRWPARTSAPSRSSSSTSTTSRTSCGRRAWQQREAVLPLPAGMTYSYK